MIIKYKMMLITFLCICLFLYLVLVIVIYFSQSKLLYHPSENNYLDETSLNHKIEKIFIPSDNDLVAWYYKKMKATKHYFFFTEMRAN